MNLHRMPRTEVKNAAGHGSRLTENGVGARGAPFAGQRHGGVPDMLWTVEGQLRDCLRLRRHVDADGWMPWAPRKNPGNTQWNTRAATERFVIGRHARAIRHPPASAPKVPKRSEPFQTKLAMACVLLRNRSGLISIPGSLLAVFGISCCEMQPGVNVAPNWRACHAVRHGVQCGSRQNVRG